ncbi:hypothetical protein CHCC14809_0201 [Bacillus licheniformis]|nr:hypothetical protein CHCC15087_2543 [Bacillus licheniformis]TWM82463.1 hypothetical protein CHCC14809_0201 [Bacillus licheniformis]TWO11294.1 hypothetical protein CHCC14431_2850 [Bacillus licheniformis]
MPDLLVFFKVCFYYIESVFLKTSLNLPGHLFQPAKKSSNKQKRLTR